MGQQLILFTELDFKSKKERLNNERYENRFSGLQQQLDLESREAFKFREDFGI